MDRESRVEDMTAEPINTYDYEFGLVMGDADVWEALMNAPVKFWTCPERHPREPLRETVRWNGDVATCLDCGRTNAD